MDATTIGAILALVGVMSGSVVAYLGKRGENATTRMNSEIDQIQEERDKVREERDKLREQLGARDQKIEQLLEQRLVDREEVARLRIKVRDLGGDP